ncbi:MAG: transporter substrate-binding domain-containing protein [Proteobacteria bacterium]|nr:transporter substrate-binding domain-containing protein [Pseudomonadota bacterium]
MFNASHHRPKLPMILAIISAGWSISSINAQAHAVNVCAFPQSPTKSIDAEVAHAVFRKLALPYTTVDLQAELGKRATSDVEVANLLRKTCDVFMGVPIAKSDQQFKSHTTVSVPYLDADFVKFSMAKGDKNQEGHGVVAVAYKSPAQFIAVEEKDANFDVENTPDDVIKSVVDGKTEYGIAWYPSLVAYEHAHPEIRFHTQQTHTNISNWKLSFVANDRNRALASRISNAIHALSTSGTLEGITGPWAYKKSGFEYRATHRPALTPAVYYPTRSNDPDAYRVIRISDTEASEQQANFSADQVGPGKTAYAAECAMCHGDHLEGRTAPALAGQGFAPRTNSTMTIGGIYQYMTTNMPAEKPGKLKPGEYANIMAYLLHKNGYTPSGKALSPETAGDDQQQFDSFVK